MKLNFEDFELIRYGLVYYYAFKKKYPMGLGPNWPFHKVKSDKTRFLESTGLVKDSDTGKSFPELDSEVKATMLLVLAIADYNDRL